MISVPQRAIEEFGASKEINLQKKNTIISLIRTSIGFSPNPLTNEEGKNFVVSKIFQYTAEDFSGSQEEKYKKFIAGYIYSGIDLGFVPLMFTEFYVESINQPDEFPFTLNGWRTFSQKRTGNNKCLFLSGSINSIKILDEKTKKKIEEIEGEFDDLIDNFSKFYKSKNGNIEREFSSLFKADNAFEIGPTDTIENIIKKVKRKQENRNQDFESFITQNQGTFDKLENDFDSPFHVVPP
jgi:hypothetical protein